MKFILEHQVYEDQRFIHPILSMGCVLSIVLLAGCTTTSTLSSVERERYLASFIGQSSQTIQAELDLSKLGYQRTSPVEVSSDYLLYRVAHPISIPLPMAENPAMGMGSGAAVPIPSGNTRYEVELNCLIQFRIKHNIATDVRLTGRTC